MLAEIAPRAAGSPSGWTCATRQPPGTMGSTSAVRSWLDRPTSQRSYREKLNRVARIELIHDDDPVEGTYVNGGDQARFAEHSDVE